MYVCILYCMYIYIVIIYCMYMYVSFYSSQKEKISDLYHFRLALSALELHIIKSYSMCFFFLPLASLSPHNVDDIYDVAACSNSLFFFIVV